MADANPNNHVILWVNGNKIVVEEPSAAKTLASYLRDTLFLRGCKLGCSSSGCGSCTVSVQTKQTSTPFCIYACTTKLWTCHGASITTIESLVDSSLPEALVRNHGVQCGFCSPGMVMSAACKPKETDIEDCLQGNLCRCTGYRPILEAFKKHVEVAKNEEKKVTFEEVPSLEFTSDQSHYFMPQNLREVRDIQSRFEKTKFLQGGTGWYQRACSNQSRDYGVAIIHLGMVSEMQQINVSDQGVYLGAGVTLSHALNVLKGVTFCQPFVNALEGLASVQVRNQATIGGSLHWNHPSNDLKPLFKVYHCLVKYDQQNNFQPIEEILESKNLILEIFIPNPGLEWRGVFRKKASRKSFDLALLNMAALFTIEDEIVKDIRIIFAGKVGRGKAQETMRYLQGQPCTDLDETALLKHLSIDLNGHQTGCRMALDFILGMFDEKNAMPKKKSSMQVFKAEDLNDDDNIVVHKSIPHLWGTDLARGKAVFVADILPQPNELQLILIQSQAAHAEFNLENVSEVLKMEGIHGIITSQDIPEHRNYWGLMLKDERVLASKVVEYHGQVIGGILCSNQELGRKALAKLKIEYQHLPYVLNLKHAQQVFKSFETLENFGGTIPLVRNQDKPTGKGYLELNGTLRIAGAEHFYMEPHTVLVIPQGEKEELVLHFSTQEVCNVQEQLASVTGLPMHKIIVKNKRAGGGFGGKERMHVALIAGVAAIKYQRPIRLALSRAEDMQITGQRAESMVKYKVKVDKQNGRVMEANFQAYCNAGISADLSIPWILMLMMRIDGGYTFRNFSGQGQAIRTNSPSNTAFRGFGGPEGAMYSETLMDRIAEELNLPVLAVKEANLTQEGDLLHYGVSRVRGCTLQRCWHECLEKSQYELKQREIEAFNAKNPRVKRGISIVPIKFTPSMMTKSAMKGSALVRIYRDGSVLLSHGGIEMGQGLHTKMIQVASTALGCPMEWIHINETSSETLANTSPTGGSSGTDLNGPAVLDACHKINEKLAPFKEADPQGNWVSWVIAALQARVCLTVVGHYDQSPVDYDPVDQTGDPYAYFTFGACAVQVEVNCYTGQVNVINADIVMDVGKSLNPHIDVGQIEGAFMMVYGMITTEELKRDLASGQLLTCGPDNYKIPTASDVPQALNVYLLEHTGDGPTSAVYSSKGIGEPGILSAA